MNIVASADFGKSFNLFKKKFLLVEQHKEVGLLASEALAKSSKSVTHWTNPKLGRSASMPGPNAAIATSMGMSRLSVVMTPATKLAQKATPAAAPPTTKSARQTLGFRRKISLHRNNARRIKKPMTHTQSTWQMSTVKTDSQRRRDPKDSPVR